MPSAPLAGKTVIDTCNYGPERDGRIPDLDATSLTSSELLLRYIPDAMLVKAFILEREGPAGRRGRHPRGTGHRNPVTASWRGPQYVPAMGR